MVNAIVMGKFKKPYRLDNGTSGISYRVSICIGEYLTDPISGAVGSGEKFIEVKCRESLFTAININDEILIELDEKEIRLGSMKSAMLSVGDGAYKPLEC